MGANTENPDLRQRFEINGNQAEHKPTAISAAQNMIGELLQMDAPTLNKPWSDGYTQAQRCEQILRTLREMQLRLAERQPLAYRVMRTWGFTHMQALGKTHRTEEQKAFHDILQNNPIDAIKIMCEVRTAQNFPNNGPAVAHAAPAGDA